MTLRQALKARTRTLHDRLDAAASGAAVDDARGYAGFLAMQYSARAPIERWASGRLEELWCPPSTAALIAGDLAELGRTAPAEEAFVFPASADPRGLAWALGGSSLGNKSLLVARHRAGLAGPDDFLSDRRSADYFRRILPLLEIESTSAEADAAVGAAEAVFRTFLAASCNLAGRVAA